MAKTEFTPCKRKEFIRKLKGLGFSNDGLEENTNT